MLFNLLDDATSSAPSGSNPWSMLLMIGVFAVLLVVMMVFNRRSQKKREEETKNLLAGLKPGNTVKTIGGICGTVVEVCEDGTFVLETGTDVSGKSYLKFDKFAIAQTDAVPVTPDKNKQEEPLEEPVEDTAKEPLEDPVQESEEK